MSSTPGSDGAFGDSPFGLLVASPHSETTLSIVLTVCLDTDSMITGRGYVLLGFIVSITVLADDLVPLLPAGPARMADGKGDPTRPARPVRNPRLDELLTRRLPIDVVCKPLSGRNFVSGDKTVMASCRAKSSQSSI